MRVLEADRLNAARVAEEAAAIRATKMATKAKVERELALARAAETAATAEATRKAKIHELKRRKLNQMKSAAAAKAVVDHTDAAPTEEASADAEVAAATTTAPAPAPAPAHSPVEAGNVAELANEWAAAKERAVSNTLQSTWMRWGLAQHAASGGEMRTSILGDAHEPFSEETATANDEERVAQLQEAALLTATEAKLTARREAEAKQLAREATAAVAVAEEASTRAAAEAAAVRAEAAAARAASSRWKAVVAEAADAEAAARAEAAACEEAAKVAAVEAKAATNSTLYQDGAISASGHGVKLASSKATHSGLVLHSQRPQRERQTRTSRNSLNARVAVLENRATAAAASAAAATSRAHRLAAAMQAAAEAAARDMQRENAALEVGTAIFAAEERAEALAKAAREKAGAARMAVGVAAKAHADAHKAAATAAAGLLEAGLPLPPENMGGETSSDFERLAAPTTPATGHHPKVRWDGNSTHIGVLPMASKAVLPPRTLAAFLKARPDRSINPPLPKAARPGTGQGVPNRKSSSIDDAVETVVKAVVHTARAEAGRVEACKRASPDAIGPWQAWEDTWDDVHDDDEPVVTL